MLGHGAVVGGNDGRNAEFDQMVEDRPGQRRSLFRVGTGAQLVQQHKRPVVRLRKDVDDRSQMRREGRYRSFDALGVSNVHIYSVKHGNLGPGVARDLHAALVHQYRKTRRLERDRLTAGVRTGDNESTEAGADRKTDRDRLLPEQRVPDIDQVERHLVARRQRNGTRCTHRMCQPGAREHQVQPARGLDRSHGVPGAVTHQFGKASKDLLLLADDLGRGLSPAVAQVYGVERLDEQRLPGVGHVMHDPRHRGAFIRAHLHNQPITSRCDYRRLYGPAYLRPRDQALQVVGEPAVSVADTGPEPPEVWRRGVPDISAIVDRLADAFV